jgi:hypothetical protein
MQITFDTSGLQALRARIAEARAAVPELLQQAVEGAGSWTVQNLGAAAPVGTQSGGGPPPAGDAAGPLAESFYMQEEASQFANGARVSVRTRQPQKLEWIVQGRGEVRPVTKRALYWPGLAHPVKYAGPSKANDFVTPVLASMPGVVEVLGVVAEELQVILEG